MKPIAKYYDLHKTDSNSALTFLHCYGGIGGTWNNEQLIRHIMVKSLNSCNRYSINSRAHKHVKGQCSQINSGTVIGGDDTCIVVCPEYYNSYNSEMFDKFVIAANSQCVYNNNDGTIVAIPKICILYYCHVTRFKG